MAAFYEYKYIIWFESKSDVYKSSFLKTVNLIVFLWKRKAQRETVEALLHYPSIVILFRTGKDRRQQHAVSLYVLFLSIPIRVMLYPVLKNIEVSTQDSKKNDEKRLDEPCKVVLTFPETGEVSLFKKWNYKISVSIELVTLPLLLIVGMFDIGTSSNIIAADVQNTTWLDSIPQRDMPEIWSTPDTKLIDPKMITFLVMNRESRTRVILCVVDRVALTVLLGRTLIDRYNISVHPAERKVTLYHSRLVPV